MKLGLPEFAKHGAVTADDTAVAKTDGRLLEIAKCGDKAVNCPPPKSLLVILGLLSKVQYSSNREGYWHWCSSQQTQSHERKGHGRGVLGRPDSDQELRHRTGADVSALEAMEQCSATPRELRQTPVAGTDRNTEIRNACGTRDARLQPKVWDGTEVFGASITRSGPLGKKQLSTRGSVQAESVLVGNNPVAHGSGPSFV